MNKIELIAQMFKDKSQQPQKEIVQAFAPANIALCKYWGKRDTELNLPLTSSLSISLGNKGTQTQLQIIDSPSDEIYLNHKKINPEDEFAKKITQFINLFQEKSQFNLRVNTVNNIPVAAGLASSASGFAALVLALDQLYHWQCSPTELSILARLGSGSACRSFWPGFVEWQQGERADGMDSHGVHLADLWPELRLGVLMVSSAKKPMSSREAMEITKQTSILYQAWPTQVARDMKIIKQAIKEKDFIALATAAEHNAHAMHATMISAWPPICYSQPATLQAMQQIWQLRQKGLAIYFTQDAGPNLKLLFQAQDQAAVIEAFPELDMCEL